LSPAARGIKLDLLRQEQSNEHDHAERTDDIGRNHQQTATQSIGQRSTKGGEQRLRQQRHKAGGCKRRDAASGVGDPPQQYELRESRADE
jgi:hypothetical protein